MRQTEAQFQAAVIELAQLTGWMVYHARPGRTLNGWRTPVSGDGAGWPDLVLVHPRRQLVLYRELKRGPIRKLRPEQEAWHRALTEAGQDADTWVPEDWALIEATLKGEPL